MIHSCRTFHSSPSRHLRMGSSRHLCASSRHMIHSCRTFQNGTSRHRRPKSEVRSKYELDLRKTQLAQE